MRFGCAMATILACLMAVEAKAQSAPRSPSRSRKAASSDHGMRRTTQVRRASPVRRAACDCEQPVPVAVDDSYHDAGGYVDEGYADGGYVDEAYADEAYADEAYADETYADETYADETYADETYFDDGGCNTCGCHCGGCGCGMGGGLRALFGARCGCASGPVSSVPYPRCFSFQSPCATGGCGGDPCCGTIFSEMFCDLQNLFSGLRSGGCAGSCPSSPFGFRDDCGGGGGTCGGDPSCSRCGGHCGGECGEPACGLETVCAVEPSCDFSVDDCYVEPSCGFAGGGCCFQEILAGPRCVGGCGGPRNLLASVASMLFGGCTGGSSCGCSDGCGYDATCDYGHDDYEVGEFDTTYESIPHTEQPAPTCEDCQARRVARGRMTKIARSETARDTVSAEPTGRYHVVLQPGSKTPRYVSSNEFARIEQQKMRSKEEAHMATRPERISSPPTRSHGSQKKAAAPRPRTSPGNTTTSQIRGSRKSKATRSATPHIQARRRTRSLVRRTTFAHDIDDASVEYEVQRPTRNPQRIGDSLFEEDDSEPYLQFSDRRYD